MKQLIGIAAMLFITGIAAAQGVSFTQTVKGTIIDEQSGNVLQYATVTIEGLQRTHRAANDTRDADGI
jgi:hypothetical protein